MKTVLVTFLCLFSFVTLVFSQLNGTAKPFTLKGNIIGKDSGFIILNYHNNGKYIRDTAIIKKGVFVFEGNITEPILVDIVGENNLNSTCFYIEPGVIKVNLKKDKFAEFEVTGSKTQDESYELDRLQVQVESKMFILKEQLISMNDTIKNTKDEALLKKLKKNKEEKDNQYEQYREQRKVNEIGFIRSHPQSFVSAGILAMMVTNNALPLDSSKTLYKGLDQIIKNSLIGKEIKKKIDNKEKSIVGAHAPDFKATDLNNQPVILSEFRGKKEVLLVFWASWCKPCRSSFPHLKEVYKKYHSKGLEIILVSIDGNKEAWIKAVNQDSISMWHQVHSSDSFGPGSLIVGEIKDKYSVQLIPEEILIDKSGKIIARDMGLDEKLVEIYKD